MYGIKRIIVLCTITSLSPFAFSQVYKCKDAQNNPVFTDVPCKFTGGAASTPVTITTSEIEPAVQPQENEVLYLTDSIKLKLRGLLKKERYRDLNVQLVLYQASAGANPEDEDDLFTAYAAFEHQPLEYRKLLDRWVNATPDAYQPYLARAYHSYALAWAERGGKWSSETSSSQLNSMNSHFSAAQTDIETALDHGAPPLIPSYLRLGILKTAGSRDDTLPLVMKGAQNKDDAEIYRVLESALSAAPASYQIRAQFMYALYPRWGGSRGAMTRFSKLSQDYASKNPRLKWLEGFVQADMAFGKSISGAYKKAEEYYDEALLHGDNPVVLRNRGRNSYRQENYKEAILYLNRSISASPEDSETYHWRSKTYRKLREFDRALADNTRAMMLNPVEKRIQAQRTYLASDFYNRGLEFLKSVDYNSAIKHFGKAIELDAKKKSAYYRRGWAFYKIGKYDKALEDTKQSIELDPSYYYSYALLDKILVTSQDWGQIIRYWSAFIAINPGNPEAYFERSGTHYHKGDMAASYRDLKKASDLGHIKARERYAKAVSRSTN